MLDNNTYNLLLQLTEEHKSLWRIKNNYLTDASVCGECRDFWEKIRDQKEDLVEELTELVKKKMG